MAGMESVIKACTCKSPYQDEKYGKGNRVHNYAFKKKLHRCTVCSKER